MATVEQARAAGRRAVMWVAQPDSKRVRLLSLPLFRLGGVRFRLHWFFLAYALLVILRSVLGTPSQNDGALPPAGPMVAVTALVSLLVLVALREITRTFVVRFSGGAADEVELWPMGTLRGIEPAPGWRAALAASMAGLCTSAVVFALLAMPLGLATGGEWIGAAVPNPFDDSWLRNQHPQWLEILWIAQRTGMQLALLSLVPMLPLDGGLAMSALVIRARGNHDAPRAAASTSAIVAALVAGMAIMATVPESATVLVVAVVCFVEALLALRRLRLGDAIESVAEWEPQHREETQRELKARERAEAERHAAQQRAELDAKEVDRILDKIVTQGIDSLSAAEREMLRKATEQRRQGRQGHKR